LSSLDEIVDAVDEEDTVIAKKPLRECVDKGILHRAIVAILLDSTQNKVYIQKRSQNKSFYPSYWTASATGHVSSGESYLEAGRREVEEELGLDSVELRYLFKFLSPQWKFGNRTEWEYIAVFEGDTHDRKITLQASEVEEGKYVTLEELGRLVEKNETMFTPDAVMAFEGYYRLKPSG
jgi:isopentenyl-diphosphate delta-isomerase